MSNKNKKVTQPNTINKNNSSQSTANAQDIHQEYMMLREEIMYLLKRRDNIIQYAYTVGIAIFTAAFTIEISSINLLVLPLVLSTSLRFKEYGVALAHLSSYMEIHLEKDIDIKWETMNNKYLSKHRNSPRLLHLIGRCDFLWLAIISSILFWVERHWQIAVHGSITLGIVIAALQVALIIFEGVFSLYYTNNKKLKNKILNNWKLLQ